MSSARPGAFSLPFGRRTGPVSTPPNETFQPLQADDRRAVHDCVSGASGAWERFVDRFAGLFAFVVDRTARQRGTPLAAADREDLVADILLECIRNDAAVLRAFAGRSSLATYLTVIARRVAARHLATAKPVRTTDVPEAATTDPDHVAQREQVESLLAKLAPDEARLVRLHHLEHRSYGDISRLTGMPVNSIGPALSRAKDKMRQ